jgi:hypothetical protein
MVADILVRILEWKRQEVIQAQQHTPLPALRQQVADLPPTRGFRQACSSGIRWGRGLLRR